MLSAAVAGSNLGGSRTFHVKTVAFKNSKLKDQELVFGRIAGYCVLGRVATSS